MIVQDEKVSNALHRLAETDSRCADAKVDYERYKYVAKRKRAHVVILESGTGPVKAAKSEIDKEVIESENKALDCLQEYERLAAERKTLALVIEVWRTEQANRRAGNL